MNPKESIIIERLKGDGCSLRYILGVLDMTLLGQAREFCLGHGAKPCKGSTKWRIPSRDRMHDAEQRMCQRTTVQTGDGR